MVKRRLPEASGQQGRGLDRRPAGELHGGMWLKALRYPLYAAAVLALAAGSFMAGALVGRRVNISNAPEVLVEWPAVQHGRARVFFEAAMASRFAGRHREALDRFGRARLLDPGLRGLDYQFGLTYLDLGDYEAAEASARRAVERDEERGSALALSAMVTVEKAREQGRLQTMDEVVAAQVQAAGEADPLNPMPLYVLAEFHRLRGRPESAVVAYQQALERVAKTDSLLVSTVKAGLSGLRLHHQPGANQLKQNRINGVLPPEQLFFGAADALLRRDQEAAAGYLREVRTQLPEDLFEALLQDSFFHDHLPAGILADPRESPPRK
jgi:tetratricopeptide (TPR) repeat protein